MYKLSSLRKPDPQGLHVIDSSGDAVWVSTPFFASSWDAIGLYKPNTPFIVYEVGYAKDGQMMFIIDNKAYPSDMFNVTQDYP